MLNNINNKLDNHDEQFKSLHNKVDKLFDYYSQLQDTITTSNKYDAAYDSAKKLKARQASHKYYQKKKIKILNSKLYFFCCS